MQRKDAEMLITKFIKPIYGFALKRAKSLQDAEDLSQEIANILNIPKGTVNGIFMKQKRN